MTFLAKKKEKKSKRPAVGFTLIELLVVIVIVGILVSVTMIMLNNVRGKGRDAKRVSDIRAIVSALEIYNQDENAYPAAITPNQALVGPTSGLTYINKVPANPTPRTDGTCLDADYAYTVSADRRTYTLTYCLGGPSGEAVAGDNTAANGAVVTVVSGGEEGGGSSNASWQVVGTAGFNYSSATYNDLDFNPSTNLPYATFMANNYSNAYYYDGSAWTYFGGFSNSNKTSMTFDPSTYYPHVQYVNADSYEASIKYYNGSAWTLLGSASFSGTADIYYQDVAFNPATNQLYSAHDNVDDYARVMYYNGSAWTLLGADGFSGALIHGIDIEFNPATNQPYVAITTGPCAKASVYYYNGSAWTAVGSTNFSSGCLNYMYSHGISLAFNPSTNQPYVSFKDSNNKATVMSYNGSSWAVVGSAGFSAGEVNMPAHSLAFNPTTNQPYVAYSDLANGSKATVMSYDGSAWATVGSAGFSAGTADWVAITFNPSTKEPYVLFADGANSSKATVMRYGE